MILVAGYFVTVTYEYAVIYSRLIQAVTATIGGGSIWKVGGPAGANCWRGRRWMGWILVRGIHLPSQLRGLRECRKLSNGVRDGTTAEIWFCRIYKCQRSHLVAHSTEFSAHSVVVLQLIVVLILIATSHWPTQRKLTIDLCRLGLSGGVNWLLWLAWSLKSGQARDSYGQHEPKSGRATVHLTQ